MNTKRVFILGAGFSKQVDMPLATELVDPLLKKFQNINHDEMLSWYKLFEEKIKWIEGDNINIEQVFALAPFDIEAWRMKQQVQPQKGKSINNAENIKTWLSWMEYDLAGIIWDRQKNSMQKQKIREFSENLKIEDVVITFNYDTLLEESLNKQNKLWHYGFDTVDRQEIKILKMHGSLNWKIAQKDGHSQNDVLLFPTEHKNNTKLCETISEKQEYHLFHVSNNEVDGFIKSRVLLLNSTNYIGIAGLGTYKSLHLLPGSWKVWSNAIRALKETEEIYIIGFSLSPFDSMARMHFAGAMLDRHKKGAIPKKIVLIDPYACSLSTNFEKVFGKNPPISIYQNKAEEINWTQLLI